MSGPWTVSFIAGGPRRPKPIQRETLVSITEFGNRDLLRFGGTIRYETRFDVSDTRPTAGGLELNLGDVRHSARVFLNGCDLGVCVQAPYRFTLSSDGLKPGTNDLVVEVTTLAANRIRDLDRRGIPWRIFRDINFVTDRYQPFDASDWPLEPAGLLGPVQLT